MRLQEMSSMGIGNKPCLDIRPSADQISDRSISITQLNKSEYLYVSFQQYPYSQHVRWNRSYMVTKPKGVKIENTSHVTLCPSGLKIQFLRSDF